MFALPSLWNLVISTLVFFLAARYLHRLLEGQGLPKGMTRGTLVFVLASLVSWVENGFHYLPLISVEFSS